MTTGSCEKHALAVTNDNPNNWGDRWRASSPLVIVIVSVSGTTFDGYHVGAAVTVEVFSTSSIICGRQCYKCPGNLYLCCDSEHVTEPHMWGCQESSLNNDPKNIAAAKGHHKWSQFKATQQREYGTNGHPPKDQSSKCGKIPKKHGWKD